MLEKQKEKTKLTVREQKYFSYIEKYPVLATLMVLEEYEKQEEYRECAMIKNALDAKGTFTRKDDYMNSKTFTITALERETKTAKTNADKIKIKLPI